VNAFAAACGENVVTARSCQHALDDVVVTIATIDGQCFLDFHVARVDSRTPTAYGAIASTNENEERRRRSGMMI